MKIKQETKEVYKERIRRVLDYIDLNLEKQLSIQQLAMLGNFSEFHFHRLMRAHLREPLMRYITRQRVERVASLLT